MRRPKYNMNLFKERRTKLAKHLENAALILPAHPEFIRNHDVHHTYRQDTNLFYLTGFEEPESVFIFRPGKKPETVLFVREKNVERETWDGFRYGPKAAAEEFHMDETYTFDKFQEIAPELLLDVEKVYYKIFQDKEFDAKMDVVLHAVQAKKRRSGKGILPIYDSYPLIGEQRLIKTPTEIEALRSACRISAEAHVEVMKQVCPGRNERHIHGIFINEIFARGCVREGYGGIVAGGANCTTLHYVFNDQSLKDGDLLLIDAGGEFDYFTGDITRTYPVNGVFSPVQKRLYQKVLTLQKSLIQMIQPGVVFSKFQEQAISGLVDIMLDEKLLKGSKTEIIENKTYMKYYPHGVSHFLGMDVHDAGMVEINGASRPLESGMCFTIEPGIYIPQNDNSAPEELRGIGIRIEDDVLVTATGCEVMTAAALKEISDLEGVIGSKVTK